MKSLDKFDYHISPTTDSKDASSSTRFSSSKLPERKTGQVRKIINNSADMHTSLLKPNPGDDENHRAQHIFRPLGLIRPYPPVNLPLLRGGEEFIVIHEKAPDVSKNSLK